MRQNKQPKIITEFDLRNLIDSSEKRQAIRIVEKLTHLGARFDIILDRSSRSILVKELA